MAQDLLPIQDNVLKPRPVSTSLPVLTRPVLPYGEEVIKSSNTDSSFVVHSPGTAPLGILGLLVCRQFPGESTSKLSLQFEKDPCHRFFVFFPRVLLVDRFTPPSNFDVQDAVTSFHSRAIIDFIFHFLALFVPCAIIPRLVAGTPTLSPGRGPEELRTCGE